jgi:hypothetical protein
VDPSNQKGHTPIQAAIKKKEFLISKSRGKSVRTSGRRLLPRSPLTSSLKPIYISVLRNLSRISPQAQPLPATSRALQGASDSSCRAQTRRARAEHCGQGPAIRGTAAEPVSKEKGDGEKWKGYTSGIPLPRHEAVSDHNLSEDNCPAIAPYFMHEEWLSMAPRASQSKSSS